MAVVRHLLCALRGSQLVLVNLKFVLTVRYRVCVGDSELALGIGFRSGTEVRVGVSKAGVYCIRDGMLFSVRTEGE